MPSKYTAKININEFHLYSKKDRKNSQDILDNYITKDIGQNVKEYNDITDDGRLPMTKAHMAYGQVS
jgi:hypothetical protein